MKKLFLVFFILLTFGVNAFATTVTVGASTQSSFNPSGIGNDVAGITVGVTNNTTTVTSSALFRAAWVGLSGFRVSIGGVVYTVASVDSTSSLVLTAVYAGATGSTTMTVYKYVEVRFYSNIAFRPLGSSEVIQVGTPGSSAWFKRFVASIVNVSGVNTLYIPQFTLDSTTDSVDNNQARYTIGFYRPDGSLVQYYTCSSASQLRIPPTTPTSLADICIYNSTQVINIDNTAYTKGQIDARFPSCTSGQMIYYSATGQTQACLSVGANLSINSGTLNASGGAGSLTVKEVDGTPTVAGVSTVRVSNGTLTDDGGSQVTISNIGGSGTTNYVPIFTSSTAIGASQMFYDGANTRFQSQKDILIFTTAANSRLLIDTGVTLEGSDTRATTAHNLTITAVASQTGQYLRFLDSAAALKFAVDADGDAYMRGVTMAWPSANASGVLTNNGSGTLTWAAGGGTVTGTGTTNYLPIWTSSSALGSSEMFYDGGNTRFQSQKNILIFTTNTSSSLLIDADQIVLEGSGTRATTAHMQTMKAIASQTGQYLRFLDSASALKYAVDADGDAYMRGVTMAWPSANASGELSNNGSGTLTWVNRAPGGSTTHVQWNNGGSFAGDAGFTYDITLATVTIGQGGTSNGIMTLRNSTNSNNTSVQAGVPSSSLTFTLPATLPASAGCLQVGSTGIITQTGSACGSGGGMSIGGTVTSGTAGSVLFVGTGPVLAQDNSNFFFDDTNNRLSIANGTSPSVPLHVKADTSNFAIRATANAAAINVDVTADGSTGIVGTTTNHGLDIYTNTGAAIHIDGGTARLVGINSSSPGAQLEVTSTAAGTIAAQINGNASATANLLNIRKGTSNRLTLTQDAILTLGLASTVTGKIVLAVSGDADLTTLQAGDTPASAVTYKWPADDPAAADFLKVTSFSGGVAVLEWAPGGGAGTTINATDTVVPFRSNATTFVDSPLSVVTGRLISTATATSSGVAPYLRIITPVDTGQTVDTEFPGIFLGGSSTGTTVIRTGADGTTIAAQREVIVPAPTYAFAGATTITTSATLAIVAAPIAGTNATLTNKYSLWVQAGISNFDDPVSIGAGSSLAADDYILFPFTGGTNSSGPAIRWASSASYATQSSLFLSLGLIWQGADSTHDPFKIRKGTGTSSDGDLVFEFRPSTATFNLYPYGVSAGNTTEIRFIELAANGSEYVSIKAPDALAATLNLTWLNTLPASAGCLQVSSAGVISQTGSACGSGGSAPPFIDTTSIVEGSADGTKEIRFEVDGLTTATIRVLTPPDANIVIAGSASALTSGRVSFVTTGGLLLDSADFRYTTGSTQLELGTASSTTGKLRLAVSGDANFSILQAGDAPVSDVTYKWPADDPVAADFLKVTSFTGGVAVLEWATQAASMAIGGSVTSGTTGSILFVGTGPVLAQDNTNFFFDDTNNRLSIAQGTSPSVPLHVKSDASNFGLRVTGNAAAIDVDVSSDGSVGFVGTTTNHGLDIYTNLGMAIHIDGGTARLVGINATTPGAQLEVTSTANGTIAAQINGTSAATANLLNIRKGTSNRLTFTQDAIMTIGLASTVTGKIALAVSGDADLTTFQAGDTPASAVTYKWPADDPAAAEFLKVTSFSGGVAVLEWAAGGGGSSPPFTDTTSIVEGSADATKEIRFEVDGLTTGTVRVLTPPNADITIAGTNFANTFTSAQTVSNTLVYRGTLAVFSANANEPPASAFATLDTRNAHQILNFDAATDEDAVFSGVLDRKYTGNGLTLTVVWVAATATSGDVVWNAAIERIDAGGLDIDADSFATAQAATCTANGTSGITQYCVITFTSGAQMDSLASGEAFRVKVTRDANAGGDTMTGDASLLRVEIRETP